MTEDFHLIDLVSQGAVVQRLLRGKSASEKLAWLSARGTVSQMEKKEAAWPDTYYFVSTTGAKCGFVFQEDRFRFVGDHHFFTAPDDDNSGEANPVIHSATPLISPESPIKFTLYMAQSFKRYGSPARRAWLI